MHEYRNSIGLSGMCCASLPVVLSEHHQLVKKYVDICVHVQIQADSIGSGHGHRHQIIDDHVISLHAMC